MLRVSLKFFFTLSLFLLPLFSFHTLIIYYFFDLFWSENIIISYIFNLILAQVIYSGTYFFSKSISLSSILFYCIGTVLKFTLFLLCLYPKFTFDGIISKTELSAFFIPYFTCLLIETYELSKFLNSKE